jgi:hypothetical protein
MIEPEELKDVVAEMDELAHEAMCHLEELDALVVDLDDDQIADDIVVKSKTALDAVEALQDAIGGWRILTADEDDEDDGDEPELPLQPASPSP